MSINSNEIKINNNETLKFVMIGLHCISFMCTPDKNALFKHSNDVLEYKFCLGNYTVMSSYNWQESMKHTVCLKWIPLNRTRLLLEAHVDCLLYKKGLYRGGSIKSFPRLLIYFHKTLLLE